MNPSPRGRIASDTDDRRWAAVMARDAEADGAFFYAVTSTGVFCRPSCPSRRPRRDRVRFFDTALLAEHAGFRACRRCHPASPDRTGPASAAIRRAADYLAAHADEAVSLERLARIAQLSPSHLQRQFKRTLGLSPREYQSACRADRFRKELRSGRDVTTAMHEAGYGSPSRIYEGAPTGRGLTPAVYRHGARGIEIGYSIVGSPLGRLLVAGTAQGICSVKLGDSDAVLERDLRTEFPGAILARDRLVPREWVSAIVERLHGSRRELDLPVQVRGTAFQWRVWRALQHIPPGETRSYAEVAAAIGQPRAVRAVAQACASNPVSLVVPCHRVVAKSGDVGGYRWGADRKARLLAIEADGTAGRREAGRTCHERKAK